MSLVEELRRLPKADKTQQADASPMDTRCVQDTVSRLGWLVVRVQGGEMGGEADRSFSMLGFVG